MEKHRFESRNTYLVDFDLFAFEFCLELMWTLYFVLFLFLIKRREEREEDKLSRDFDAYFIGKKNLFTQNSNIFKTQAPDVG